MKEEKISKKEFIYSIPYFFIKNKFHLTNKRIKGTVPKLLLFFPIGKKEATYPLKNISSVSISTELHIIRGMIGLFFALIGLGMFGESIFVALLNILIGGSILLHSRRTYVSISNNAGQKMLYPISILEKSAAERFVSEVNNTIMER